MTQTTRYTYDFRTDKNGKAYCHITSTKTGKFVKNVSSKANLKTANRSAKQQVYRVQRAEIEKEIEWRGYGGSYADYMRERKRLIKEITLDKNKKKIKKSEKQIINQATHAAYDYVGYKVVSRFYWKFWVDVCVYANVMTDHHSSQYEEDNINKIYRDACDYIDDVYKGIISEYPLFNTPKRGNDDSGANGGQVRLIAMGSNEIVKEYNISKASILAHTIVCVNGKERKLKVGDRVNI